MLHVWKVMQPAPSVLSALLRSNLQPLQGPVNQQGPDLSCQQTRVARANSLIHSEFARALLTCRFVLHLVLGCGNCRVPGVAGLKAHGSIQVSNDHCGGVVRRHVGISRFDLPGLVLETSGGILGTKVSAAGGQSTCGREGVGGSAARKKEERSVRYTHNQPRTCWLNHR